MKKLLSIIVLSIVSLRLIAQPVGGGTVGVPVSSTGLSSNDVYNIAVAAASSIGGATNGILKLNGFGTNTTFYGNTPTVKLQYTDGISLAGNTFAATNSLFEIITNIGAVAPDETGSATYQKWLISTNGDYYNEFFNPVHDRHIYGGRTNYSAEMQITMSGGYAFSTAYGNGPTSTNANLLRRAWQWGIGGYGAPYIYHQLSLIPRLDNTNLFDSMYPEFWKCQVYTNVGGPPVAAGSLDPSFNYLPCLYFSAYNTNGAGHWWWADRVPDVDASYHSPTNITPRFEIITQGATNAGINVNGKIAVNNVLGITTNMFVGNLIMHFDSGLLTSIAPLDTDLATMLTLVGGTTTEMSNNLVTFYAALKLTGTYQKLQGLNGFCFSNAGSNGQPWVIGQPLIKWNGTFTVNDATGLISDASTGYADTQFRTSTNQDVGSMYVYCKTDGGTSAFLCGALGSGTESKIRHAGSSVWSANYNANANDLLAAVGFPCGVSIVRANSSTLNLYAGSTTAQTTTASTTPPAYNVYLCGVNNQGTPLVNWAGQIQGWAYSTNVLTQTDITTLNSAFLALRTAMGN